MKVLGIIPARYASTRFPGKALCLIGGKAMIQRVFEQATQCNSLNRIIVATDHEAIRKQVASFGGVALMTSGNHRSGTERCAEAAEIMENNGDFFDIILNIQGDEPFIDPRQIEQVINCFLNPEVQIATLVKKILSQDELFNPNVVKVARSISGQALFFSRSAIPYFRGNRQNAWINETNYYKHIGIYGFQAAVLKKLVTLPSTPLENAESLEQLRWMEYAFPIHTQDTEFDSIGIDTPEDLLKITNRNQEISS